jgi:hypothetical protein
VSLSAIDEIIARNVGELCWFMLPELQSKTIDEIDPKFRSIWNAPLRGELAAIIAADPVVPYPVIYLPTEVEMGIAPQAFVYPPVTGQPVTLSNYLRAMRHFLDIQLSGGRSHIHLVWNAVKAMAPGSSEKELLIFMDQLWRGRWIIDDFLWADMRMSLMGGGTADGGLEILRDVERLEGEALRLIQTQRALKDSCKSLDEWMHELYCLLPDICTWLFFIRDANKTLKSDELEKYDRVLDEFHADIATTLDLPCIALEEQKNFAEYYAIAPLAEQQSAAGAITKIRGIYKGRTIIPKIWFEDAAAALMSLDETKLVFPGQLSPWENYSMIRELLPSDKYTKLNELDYAQAFGRAVTKMGEDRRWVLFRGMFGY